TSTNHDGLQLAAATARTRPGVDNWSLWTTRRRAQERERPGDEAGHRARRNGAAAERQKPHEAEQPRLQGAETRTRPNSPIAGRRNPHQAEQPDSRAPKPAPGRTAPTAGPAATHGGTTRRPGRQVLEEDRPTAGVRQPRTTEHRNGGVGRRTAPNRATAGPARSLQRALHPARAPGPYGGKGPPSGSRRSGFSSSSTLTSLNVITRTFLTNLAGRYMSHTQASDIRTSK